MAHPQKVMGYDSRAIAEHMNQLALDVFMTEGGDCPELVSLPARVGRSFRAKN
jgi:hypothetical protein